MIINPFKVAKQLREQGILSMNQRNAEFVQMYNPRKFYQRVDNKLITKQLAIEADIAVPELYHVVEIEHQVPKLRNALSSYDSFVVKPAQGSGGDGIVVIMGRRGEHYLRADGTILTQEELNFHVSNILSGMFSLGGHPDKAMFEYRVEFDPIFENISYQGVPDIRVIVFQGYPVMAMARLPTRQSQGKANLHQGAVGVGIDLKTGITHTGVQHNEVVHIHPDTANPINGVTIPGWDNLLRFAASCYELTGMGYLGVDIVLDKHKGPLMLELNARPGLAIQIANQQGLLTRLEQIKTQAQIKRSAAERCAYVLM
jgi:alpha-L-glutamate ligase-like protein